MSLYCPIASLPVFTFTRLPHRSRIVNGSSCNVVAHGRVRSMAVSTKMPQQTIIRRSANYHPSIWGYDYIQSLSSNYVGESFAKRVENLKEDVRLMLATVVDPLHQLELIDNLQRLGVSYHFQDEILGILTRIYNNKQKQQSLYGVALEFRLLRQHGFDIPADIFNIFRDEKGNFKSCLNGDCIGILYLYEAAFLLKEGESMIFHDIRNFTTSYLKAYMDKQNKDEYLSTLVNHALELPLHWRMLRLEARWFIDVYERSYDMYPILLELAKLDFNIVQATHQEDLKYSLRWWRKTGLVEKLSFARDRLVENFFWNVGLAFEPQFGYCRRMSTKVNALITSIDDVYDVYGSLDELELFTDAVDRWDVSAMEQLPEYMKICFLALFNSVNEMGFDALKEHGVDIISYVKKAWADMCKAYLLEAKWYYSGYKPTLGEYIENAWLSIAAPVILVHAYFSITNPITKKDMECLEEYRTLARCSATNLRLADDLGTSSDELKRGDVPKSIQCYMHETGASEEDAREHIRELIAITWMKMNKEQVENPQFSKAFIGLAMNLSRMAQCIYQYGDGHGIEDQETKDRILSLFVNPIPLDMERTTSN